MVKFGGSAGALDAMHPAAFHSKIKNQVIPGKTHGLIQIITEMSI